MLLDTDLGSELTILRLLQSGQKRHVEKDFEAVF